MNSQTMLAIKQSSQALNNGSNDLLFARHLWEPQNNNFNSGNLVKLTAPRPHHGTKSKGALSNGYKLKVKSNN